MAQITGFSKAKREFAEQFGVDPYSSNPVLQEHLDRLARASTVASLGATVGLMAVPGGAGIAVSVAGGTQRMNELLTTLPPVDLRRINREKLQAMGVAPDVIDLFMANTVFSPRHQTLLVAALDEMNGTADRGRFVKFAVLTDTEDVALFRQRQAQMFAGYHRRVKPLERFVSVGELAAARTADGRLVFNAPLDHLAWTESMARFVSAATRQVDAMPDVKAKHLWFTGSVSPLARKSLNRLGWKVHDNAEERLLGAS